MTSNVQDAWLMASIMAGTDASDSATKNAESHLLKSLFATSFFDAGYRLKGKRIGVVRYRQGDNPHVLAVYESALKEAAGATWWTSVISLSQIHFGQTLIMCLLSEFHQH